MENQSTALTEIVSISDHLFPTGMIEFPTGPRNSAIVVASFLSSLMVAYLHVLTGNGKKEKFHSNAIIINIMLQIVV